MDSLLELGVMLVVSGVCGALAQIVFGFRRTNFFVATIVGVVGAYLGTYLARRFELPSIFPFTMGGLRIDIIWTLLGSALLMFAFSLIREFSGARGPRRAPRTRRTRRY